MHGRTDVATLPTLRLLRAHAGRTYSSFFARRGSPLSPSQCLPAVVAWYLKQPRPPHPPPTSFVKPLPRRPHTAGRCERALVHEVVT